MVKRGHGHPRGSKNKTTVAAMGASSSSLVKRRPGRPAGSKNKPKVPSAIPGPSAPSPGTSSSLPGIYSFFFIYNAQCREIQRLPSKFTDFMDGRKLREAVIREHSGGGTPFKVEVWYDGTGKQFFKGGWSRFAEDHDLHQGSFITFDYHVGTSKFDVRITTAPSARRSMKPKHSFTRFLCYVIQLSCLFVMNNCTMGTNHSSEVCI
jgi:hypothetical protein